MAKNNKTLFVTFLIFILLFTFVSAKIFDVGDIQEYNRSDLPLEFSDKTLIAPELTKDSPVIIRDSLTKQDIELRKVSVSDVKSKISFSPENITCYDGICHSNIVIENNLGTEQCISEDDIMFRTSSSKQVIPITVAGNKDSFDCEQRIVFVNKSYSYPVYENCSIGYCVDDVKTLPVQFIVPNSSGKFDIFVSISGTVYVIDPTYNEVNLTNGTFVNTTWNGTAVKLALTNTTGTYASDIFDSGDSSTNFTNVSWWRGYGWELTPSNDTNVVNPVNYTDILAYWSLDNLSEEVNGYDLTSVGASSSTTAKINKSYLVPTDSSYFSYNNNNGVFCFGNGTDDQPFSLCAWHRPTDTAQNFYYSVDDNNPSWSGRVWAVTESGVLGANNIGLTLFDSSASATIGRYTNNNAITSTSKFYHLCFTYDGSGISGGINVYIDGVDSDTTNTASGSYTAMENLTADFRVGRWATDTNLGKKGYNDEISVWNRELSASEIENLYARGQTRLNISYRVCNTSNCADVGSYTNLGVVNPVIDINNITGQYFQFYGVFETDDTSYSSELFNWSAGYDLAPTGVVNTSYLAADYNIPDFVFSSLIYVEVKTIQFNTSKPFTILTPYYSFNTEKITGSLESEIYGRYLLNGVQFQEELIRTVNDKNQPGSTSMNPESINVISPGEYNLTFEVYRTGNGAISLYNINTALVDFESTQGFFGSGGGYDVNATFSGTTFQTVQNFTIKKQTDSDNVLSGKINIEATGAEQVFCRWDCNFTGDYSPVFGTSVSSSLATSSMAFTIRQNCSGENYTASLQCLGQQGETVTFDGGFGYVGLKDLGNNPIQSNFSTNVSTNYTNTTILTAGTHNLTTSSLYPYNGSSVFIGMSVSAESSLTGPQIPQFDVLCNGAATSMRERYFSGVNDVGNIFLWHICNVTQGVRNNFTLQAVVGAGETLEIYDEILLIYETSLLDTTTINTPPVVSILNPEQGDTVYGFEWINWSTTDVQGDRFLSNITLQNGVPVMVISGINDSTFSYYWNTSNYTDGSYNLTVESCENETVDLFCGNDTVSIVIVNEGPLFTVVLPVNGSTVAGINFTLNVTNQSFVDTWWYSLNGGVNTTFSPNITIPFMSSSVVNLVVYANNSMGIVSSETVIFNFLYNPIEDVLLIVEEILEELKVIGAVLVLVAMIAFFAWFAWNDKFWVTKWVATAFAFIQGIVALGVIYANSLGYDYSELLRINLWTLAIVGMGMLFVNLAISLFLVATPEVDQKVENDKMDTKWQTRKWEQ